MCAVHVASLQLCLTVCDPMDCIAHQAPLSVGFSRQEYWSGLPCPPPGDLPDPEMESKSPALQADALPSEPPGKLRRPPQLHMCKKAPWRSKREWV